MVKFSTIGQIEKRYEFEDAIASVDVLNGDFGVVEDGEFKPAAGSLKAIMQIEVGDDMGMPEYKIGKGTNVRVVDFAQFNGETVEVYGAQLPETFAVGDMVASDATGKLVVGGAAPCLEITKIIGNMLGFEATVVAE